MTTRSTLLMLSLAMAPLSALAQTKTIVLDVPGMNCPTCPIALRKVLLKQHGVSAVAVHYEKKQLDVTYDDQQVTPATLTQTTASLGFPSQVHPATQPTRDLNGKR